MDAEPATAPGRSRLIGRDEAIDHVTRLLRRPDVRLVTLTGRSGVGKSVLAETVARSIEAEDGVGIHRAKVDRSSLRAGTDELAAVLAVRTDGPAGPPPAGRRRVVLLDGLEAVSGSSEIVAAALASDDGLTVLVTSIVPLSLPGEHVVRLQPLEVPGPDDTGSEVRDAPAARLLLTRIAEATGRAHDADLSAIATLARLLDGLPLALELAAARCAQLSVDDVVDQVEQLSPVGALTGTTASTEPHHRSLRSTILWSYRQLDGDLRRTLRRLGVFSGSFDRNAAVAVTDGLPAHLDHLVAAGLARAARPAATGDRFELVPSVSLVARELLAAEDDLVATEDRHADHFLAVAATAGPALRSRDTPEVRRRLMADVDDLVAAVHLLDRRGRREDALRLMVDIALVWEESSASALAAQLLSDLLPDVGDWPGDPRIAAEAWALAAMVAVWGPRSQERRTELVEELAHWADTVRDLESKQSLLMVLRSQVAAYLQAGAPDAAVGAAADGRAVAADLGDAWWTCQFLGWCAASHTMAADPDTARALAIEGRDLALVEGDTAQLLRLSHILVGIADAGSETGAARLSEDELIAMARRVDDAHAEGALHVGAAVRSVAVGEVAGAAGHLLEALDVGRRKGLWYIEELALVATVVVVAAGGRPGDAARIYGGLTEVLPGIQRAVAPSAMELYRSTVDKVRLALGDDEFDRAVARGRLGDWEDAIALCTTVCDELSTAGSPDAEPSSSAPSRGPLSPRQGEVLGLLAIGRTNKEIAAALGMRPKTVMHHTSQIYRRLGVRNRTEAVGEAHRLGIVGPSE